MQNSVCVIGVYFGKLPNYFGLWKKSAEKNKNVDFLIATDQIITDLPENIRIISIDLKKMELLAALKLGIPNISIKRPYKCCDFKPVYGLIFQDYISQYKYWGHCDFDMIFGDLSSFFEKYRLEDYDKFLTLGHLTMYRNTREVMERYMCKGGRVDYQEVFTTDANYAFDELYGITQIYRKNGFSQFTKRVFCDIASIYSRYRDIEEYGLDEKASNHHNQIYYWKDGHTYRKWFDKDGVHCEEYIYIHFKKRPNFQIQFDSSLYNGFYITNKGFFPLDGEPDINSAKKYNKYYPVREFLETIRNSFRLYIDLLSRKILKTGKTQ